MDSDVRPNTQAELNQSSFRGNHDESSLTLKCSVLCKCPRVSKGHA